MALGANLGDPLAALRGAARALEGLGEVRARSRIYRTAPVGGPSGQPDYLNAVVALRPDPAFAEPAALLAALLRIEARMGRERRERWAARTLDLDLLASGETVRDAPDPVLPHPRMMERAFVLAPLLDVAPTWRDPRRGVRADAALAALPEARVEPLGADWAPR